MSDQTKEIALAIAPKISAFLSCCGSVYILQDILRSHRRNEHGNRRRSQHYSRRYGPPKTLGNSAFYRIMLCLSVSDCTTSITHFMSTWPIPRDELSLDNPSEMVYGNIGNNQTCTVQGFFIQLGIVTPMYNAFLSLYYYLTMKRGWKEEQFKKVEWMGHLAILLFGFGTATVGWILELYNNAILGCAMSAYPLGCGDEPGQTPCVRGIGYQLWRWAFYYCPLWLCLSLVALCMVLLYLHMRRLDRKTDGYTRRYTQHATTAPQRRQQSTLGLTNQAFRAAISQSLFYSIACLLPWIPATVVRSMQLAGRQPPGGLIFVFAFVTPIQGLFNCLVYVRPGVVRHLEEKKKRRQTTAPPRNATKPTEDETNATAKPSVITHEGTNHGSDEEETTVAVVRMVDDDDDDDDESSDDSHTRLEEGKGEESSDDDSLMMMEEGSGNESSSSLPGTMAASNTMARTATVDFATGAVKPVGGGATDR